MNILPIVNVYNTEQHQAEYLFNREFNSVYYNELSDWETDAESLLPDDDILYKDFINDNIYNIDEDLQEYMEYMDLTDILDDDDDFIEWLMDKYDCEFVEWQIDNFPTYPMWSSIFKCDSFISKYTNELYKIGLYLIKYQDDYYIACNSAGHDFYDAYWIPLFRDVLKWIKVVDNVDEVKEYYKSRIEYLERKLKELE
jgi:hypothetical protein